MNGTLHPRADREELTARLEAFTGRSGLRGAVEIWREKIQTLADFWPLAGFIFDGPGDDPKARSKGSADGGARGAERARDALAGFEPFDRGRRGGAARAPGGRRAEAASDVFQPLRVAIAGTTISPGIFETVALLGRDETLRRIDAALAR